MPLDEEIKEVKEKLRETPVNKSTETERARLKSKIARLKEEKEQKQKEGSTSGQGYATQKRGDATVCLVGPPSVGKSTLLNKLTNAESEVASYDFTTLDVVPGMMEFRGAKIQILDVPGLIGGASDGKGRGKEVLSVVRNSDLLVIMVDEDRLELLEEIKGELYRAGIRLDEDPPAMKVEKKGEGGIDISKPGSVELAEEAMKEVLEKHGFVNCKVIVREDLDLDEFIDGIMNNRVYLPSITCINKVDSLTSSQHRRLKEENSDSLFISAKERENLGGLKERIWEELELMRIYTKERGKEPDRDEPLIVQGSSEVKDVIEKIDRDFKGEFKYAKVWGDSADFGGQKVGVDHKLEDEDVVELRF
ncbi:MAG: OBG GTPase family GTP-binding protein [Candidatus Aenigmatarchaeota archaeon]